MAGADKIVARILSEARLKAQQNIESAKTEEAAILKAANEKAEQKKSEILDKAKKDVSDKKMRMAPYAELEARKEKLRAKQEMMDEAFHGAVLRLCSLPAKQYLDILTNMVLRAVRDGSEEVILSEEDRKRLGDDLIARVNSKLKAEGKKADIRLSSGTSKIRGGFILKTGDIEINNSFEAIVKIKRDELEPEVVKMLFEEGT